MDDDSFLYHHRIKSQTHFYLLVFHQILFLFFLIFIFFPLLACWIAPIKHIVIFSALLLAGSEGIVFLDLLPYFLAEDAKMLEVSFCRKEPQGVRRDLCLFQHELIVAKLP